MSQKITSKNLHYDDSLPPFLARLRGEQAAHSGPDPILASHRRPGQKRSASEEAEDAPVVVDEQGNVITLKEVLPDGDDQTEAQEGNGKDSQTEENSDSATQGSREKEKVAGIGGSRKRKVGRVIGEQQSDGDDESGKPRSKKNSKANDNSDEAIAKASEDVRRLIGRDGDTPSRSTNGSTGAKTSTEKSKDTAPQQQKTVKSAKKKAAKKIKLSFGDDDGE